MSDKQTRITSSQVMELQQLIAAPLVATIEADSYSSQKYLDYLMKIGFESYDPVTGKIGKIRQLTFNYYSQDINGRREQNVSIPVLTLVPLPLLQVQEADFDFDIKILDALSQTTEEVFSLQEGKNIPEQQNDGGFKLRALLAPKQSENNTSNTQQSYSANMKIKVKMRQADMPAGLSNLLHLTANSVQVEDVVAEEIIKSEKNNE